MQRKGSRSEARVRREARGHLPTSAPRCHRGDANTVQDFGPTGIRISEIVFGAGAVGGLVFRPDRDTRLRAARRAPRLRHQLDRCRPGDGHSEENVGWNLKELDANPHVSMKVRIGPDHFGDIPGEVQRSMEASASLSGYADDCIWCLTAIAH